jgi:hypothetical protein
MRFSLDRWAIGLLVVAGLLLAGWNWLRDHPEYNPWAPLNIDDPLTWTTRQKIAGLRDEPRQCRAFLERSSIEFRTLPPTGEGACRRRDRLVLEPDRPAGLVLRPGAQATCMVNAGLAIWLRHGVQPAAETLFGSRVVEIEQLGTYSCRRIAGSESSRWSEHATGNAIDIAGFRLEDGRRISVLKDWSAGSDEAAFLHSVRDSACEIFGTVLSPEYNRAHADHFHLDQAGNRSWQSYCH